MYIPFCEKINKLRNFLNKFHRFANEKYRISVEWITKKSKEHIIIIIKKRELYLAVRNIIGYALIKTTYIGESKRNMATRWEENYNPIHDSEPAKRQHI